MTTLHETPSGAPTENAEPAASPGQPQVAQTITPEQFAAAVAAAEQKGKDSAFAEARRWAQAERAKVTTPAPKPEPTQQTSSQPAAGMTAAEVEAIVARRTEFVREATRAGLNPSQEAILNTLFGVEKPEVVSEWVAEKAKAFGVAQQQAMAQAAPPGNSVPPPNGITPAPVAFVPSDLPDNPLGWTKEQLGEYQRKRYPIPEDPSHPKNRAANRVLADLVRAQLGPMRIRLDP